MNDMSVSIMEGDVFSEASSSQAPTPSPLPVPTPTNEPPPPIRPPSPVLSDKLSPTFEQRGAGDAEHHLALPSQVVAVPPRSLHHLDVAVHPLRLSLEPVKRHRGEPVGSR